MEDENFSLEDEKIRQGPVSGTRPGAISERRRPVPPSQAYGKLSEASERSYLAGLFKSSVDENKEIIPFDPSKKLDYHSIGNIVTGVKDAEWEPLGKQERSQIEQLLDKVVLFKAEKESFIGLLENGYKIRVYYSK